MKRTLLAAAVLLMLVFSLVCAQEQQLSPALASLVAAERAFARNSVEKGIRESFLAFFADDGINFQPHPTKTKEAFLKRPAPATRPPVTLDWQPAYADVSGAGDLGYTTGPYVFTDQSPEKRPPHYGFYFSIWKKQADGTWKVVVDCGIDTPDHSNQTFVLKAPQTQLQRASAKIDLENERAALISLDRRFMKTATSSGLVGAYLSYLADDTRVHRNGMFPVLGKDSAQTLLSQVEQLTWQPVSSDVSQSDDLGYTYGSYELKYGQARETQKGYYVRVWKRDRKSQWKIVLDTQSPIPSEKK